MGGEYIEKGKKGLLVFAALLFFIAFVTPAFAITPPRPGELELYLRDGTFYNRLKFARSLGCDRFHPSLIQRKLLEKKIWEEGNLAPLAELAQFPYATGLPSEGLPPVNRQQGRGRPLQAAGPPPAAHPLAESPSVNEQGLREQRREDCEPS